MHLLCSPLPLTRYERCSNPLQVARTGLVFHGELAWAPMASLVLASRGFEGPEFSYELLRFGDDIDN